MGLYDNIPSGYYLKAMIHGYPVQRFWHKSKLAEISKYIPDNPNITLLDLGCGAGNFFFQHKKGAKKRIGIDIARKQILYARRIMPDAEWICADITRTKLPKADYVVLSEIIEHVPNNIQLIKKIHITLNNDGKLILTTPNYSSFWWLIEHLWRLVSPIKYKEHHINMFTLSRLRKFVNMAGFKIKELKTLFLITPFIALFSEALAQKLLPYEQKIIGQFGLIIFAVLEKQKQL